MATSTPVTRLLYHDDPYLRAVEAQVLQLIELPGFKPPRSGIILDRTVFYAEGGGQPGDRGSLGEYKILDTQKAGSLNLGESGAYLHEDEPVHIMALNNHVKTGQNLTLALDWPHRLDYMQQHSGQHLLSAAFWQIGAYPTVSVHQGEQYTTIEFEAGDISDDDIRRASAMANDAISADLAISSRIVSDDELSRLKLRRGLKVNDKAIRILEIAGAKAGVNTDSSPGSGDSTAQADPFDRVGCGGVHLTRTGEIRLIQHLRTERIRGRVRLYWKIGDRALADYDLKHRVCDELGTALSRSVLELPQRVQQMSEEIVELRRQLKDLQRSSMYGALDEAMQDSAGKNSAALTCVLPEADMSLLRDSVKYLQKNNIDKALLIATHSENPGKIFWCILDGSDTPIDFQSLKSSVLDGYGARGGGKAPVWQGSIETQETDSLTVARRFLTEIESAL